MRACLKRKATITTMKSTKFPGAIRAFICASTNGTRRKKGHSRMTRNNNEGTAENAKNAKNDEAAEKRRKAKSGIDGTEWKVCAGHTGPMRHKRPGRN